MDKEKVINSIKDTKHLVKNPETFLSEKWEELDELEAYGGYQDDVIGGLRELIDDILTEIGERLDITLNLINNGD